MMYLTTNQKNMEYPNMLSLPVSLLFSVLSSNIKKIQTSTDSFSPDRY